MPQAIAAFIVTAIGATGIGAALITAVVMLGISTGINALLGAIFGKGGAKPSDGQQVVRQAAGSRTRNYGIVHTGGLLSFFESSGGTLGQVVTLGTGEEGAIVEHRINNNVVSVDGSGVVTDASYHGAVSILTRNGSPTQTAIGELTAVFSQWTTNHRQRGCAHAAIIARPVKQKLFTEVYNGQMPQYTQVRHGVKIYDPRLDSTAGGSGAQRLNDPTTWTSSDNAALVLADFAAHPDGYGLGYSNVNWANIAAEAVIADQAVTPVGGGTIARWRLWASYRLAQDERRQVLADMLKAVDGFCWQDATGKFNLKLGRWEAPATTITDDHVLSMSARLGPPAQQRVSAIKVLYTEAAIGYREQESATIGGTVGGDDPNTDPQSIEAYYAPHHNQAARIGKLNWRRLDDGRWHIVAQLNLFGLNLLGERFCRFESDQAGIYGWFALDGQLKLDLARMRVEATLTEVDPSDWDFDASTEEGTPPVTASSGIGAVTIEVPTGLALNAVQIVLGTGTAVAIEASWDAGRDGLSYAVRYRPTAGGTWVMMTVDNDARTARSGPVDSGIQYEVQVMAMTLTFWAGAWSASVTITPNASTLVSAPTSLAATGAAGSASVTFRMPPEASLAYARLYRATSSSFGSAVQVGSDIVGGLSQVMTISDTGLSAGTKYYWARAFNGAGSPSALAGPVTATVT